MGLMLGANDGPDGGTLAGLIKLAQDAEARGFDDLWMANIFGRDAISTLSIIGSHTDRIGLGTAVTPTYPRHPTALAQQAMTAGAAAPGRFRLGIGLSHKVVIENMLGFSYEKPARHMREYLTVLGPLMRGEAVAHAGTEYNVNLQLTVPDAGRVPILVAALGPQMLKLTGELADGTVTWMTGPKTLEEHIVPSINTAAASAGKPDATVAAGFPIVVTNDVDDARESIGKTFAMYGQLPSYRAMLDREGSAGPADLAMVGDENSLRGSLQRLKDVGVTDFCAAISPTAERAYQRTLEFLAGDW